MKVQIVDDRLPDADLGVEEVVVLFAAEEPKGEPAMNTAVPHLNPRIQFAQDDLDARATKYLEEHPQEKLTYAQATERISAEDHASTHYKFQKSELHDRTLVLMAKVPGISYTRAVEHVAALHPDLK